MRLGFVVFTLVVAVALDDISTALGLFASIALPFVTVIFPVAFNWSIRKQLALPQVGFLRLTLHIVLVLGAIFAWVFGIMGSIKKIVQDFGDAGAAHGA